MCSIISVLTFKTTLLLYSWCSQSSWFTVQWNPLFKTDSPNSRHLHVADILPLYCNQTISLVPRPKFFAQNIRKDGRVTDWIRPIRHASVVARKIWAWGRGYQTMQSTPRTADSRNSGQRTSILARTDADKPRNGQEKWLHKKVWLYCTHAHASSWSAMPWRRSR